MMPKCSSYFRDYFREFQLVMSSVFMGVGWGLAWEIPGDSDTARTRSATLGSALILAGWLVHPGSKGDDSVLLQDQQRLVPGMLKDAFGSPGNLAWSLGRMGGTLAMAYALAEHSKGQQGEELSTAAFLRRKEFYAWATSGATMAGYSADRAWGNFRLQRVHPLAASWKMRAAWLINYCSGNLLDISAVMLSRGIQYGVRSAKPGANAGFQPTDDDYAEIIVPMLIGAFVSQLVTSILASTSYRESRRARLGAHMIRLAARFCGRMIYTRDGVVLALNLASDAVSALFMHRWGLTDAQTFQQGLQVQSHDAFKSPVASEFRNRAHLRPQLEPAALNMFTSTPSRLGPSNFSVRSARAEIVVISVDLPPEDSFDSPGRQQRPVTTVTLEDAPGALRSSPSLPLPPLSRPPSPSTGHVDPYKKRSLPPFRPPKS